MPPEFNEVSAPTAGDHSVHLLQTVAVMPGAVGSSVMGNLIQTGPNDYTSVISGSVSTANGTKSTIFVTVSPSTTASTPVLSTTDIGIFVGSVSADSSNNLLRMGSGITPSQWQVFGPFYDLQQTNNFNQVLTVLVNNISAGSTTLIVRARTRFIISQGGSSG